MPKECKMAEFLDKLSDSELLDTIAGYILIFGVGALFYIANWVCFFNNCDPKKKWVSLSPPLGGLLTAVGILTAGGGWWALIGLTDPWIFVAVYALAKEFITDKNKENDKNDKHD